jgi:hypothetical protein
VNTLTWKVWPNRDAFRLVSQALRERLSPHEYLNFYANKFCNPLESPLHCTSSAASAQSSYHHIAQYIAFLQIVHMPLTIKLFKPLYCHSSRNSLRLSSFPITFQTNLLSTGSGSLKDLRSIPDKIKSFHFSIYIPLTNPATPFNEKRSSFPRIKRSGLEAEYSPVTSANKT